MIYTSAQFAEVIRLLKEMHDEFEALEKKLATNTYTADTHVEKEVPNEPTN